MQGLTCRSSKDSRRARGVRFGALMPDSANTLLMLLGTGLILLGTGCDGTDEQGQAATTQPTTQPSASALPEIPTRLPRYPAPLSNKSTPTDVAKVMLRALRENDTDTLLGIVDATWASQAIEEPLKKRGMDEAPGPHQTLSLGEAAAMALEFWRHNYAFLEPQTVEVIGADVEPDREKWDPVAEETVTIHGREAIVRALGRSKESGKPVVMVIPMARTHSVWRVGPRLMFEKP